MPPFAALTAVVIGHLDATVLAHQGGWDEILMVATPIAIFATLLAVANKRAARLEAERGDDAPGALEESTPPSNERAGPL